jgi:hypothetical protein
MSTTSKQTSTPRSIAVLKLPTTVAALINVAQAIAKALTSNPHIPNPTPTVAALTAGPCRARSPRGRRYGVRSRRHSGGSRSTSTGR